MKTLAITREYVGARALPSQYHQSQHVDRTTYPDPQVFDKNQDGRFDALDIVTYGPSWARIPLKAEQVAEEKRPESRNEQPDTNKSTVAEHTAQGLKQYKLNTEVLPEHALELTA